MSGTMLAEAGVALEVVGLDGKLDDVDPSA